MEKTPSFHAGASGPVLRQLIDSFLPLLDQAAAMVADELDEDVLRRSEYQSLAQSVFALLARTATTKLPGALQKESLELTLRYLNMDIVRNDCPLLYSQLILTGMTLFEVYETSILEEMPSFFDVLVSGFKSLGDEFSESVLRALLKASLSIVTFFYKFLSAQMIGSLVAETLVLPQLFQDEVTELFGALGKEAARS